MSREQLLEFLPGVDAMLAGGESMTTEVFDSAPSLRVVARTGVGYDAIDLAAATRRKVVVAITPGTNQGSVAEHTFALLLALARDVVPNNAAVHAGIWERKLVRPVRGKTLGIIGMGRIGQAVAARARSFEMRVVAFDPIVGDVVLEALHVTRLTLSELVAQSDFISLHAPLTETTRGMINREFLARMRPGSFLINTARGGLVVESDLRDSLVAGHLAGAGLDVLDREPPEPGNPLIGLPNVVLSPHLAGTDFQSMSDMAAMAAQLIVDLHHGRWPDACVVNREIRPAWQW